MSDRVTGGTGTGGSDPYQGSEPDADLEELRRTSPRRAARLAEARQAAAAGSVPGTQGVAGGRDQVFDQDATPATASIPTTAAAVAYDQPAVPEAYDEPLLGDGYAQPVGEVYDDPFADPAQDEVFGDPVADGYVPVVDAGPPVRRRRRGAGVLALVVAVALVSVAGWFAYQGLRPVVDDLAGVDLFDSPEDYTGAGTGSVEVVVSPGDAGRQIGNTLVDAGVVASVEAFLAAANAEPEFTSVQPGRYTLPQQLPAVDAVAALLDPANRVNDTVVIAEGLRVDQILTRLSERTGIPVEELQAALDAAELPAGAREVPGLVNPAEGFLYPDGYQFGENPTAEQVITTMIARGQEVLAAAGVAPENQLEVLTKASLVQGEARLDEDFGKVAQVIENRLAIGQPLELDSTVNYATQTFDTRTTDAQRDSDSPFNTYRFAGLPPGPIKSPGLQAIEAVANPTPGPWLYFVTVDLCTGETAFAESYDEHLANVRVLNAWQQENTNEDGTLNCG